MLALETQLSGNFSADEVTAVRLKMQ